MLLMRTSTHTHTSARIAALIFILVFAVLNGIAQNFSWLNGATGKSWGNGTTIDSSGQVITVGAFAPNGDFQLSGLGAAPLTPSPNTIGADYAAFISWA